MVRIEAQRGKVVCVVMQSVCHKARQKGGQGGSDWLKIRSGLNGQYQVRSGPGCLQLAKDYGRMRFEIPGGRKIQITRQGVGVMGCLEDRG